MIAVAPMPELTDLILEVGGHELQVCMQCGTCTAVCPWPRVKPFSPRQVIRYMAFGFEGFEQEDLWNCVTCRTCVQRCPRGIDLLEVMRAARAVMLESGSGPRTFSGPLASLRTEGNPWAGERQERYGFAAPRPVPPYDTDKDYLFFSCCTQSYDPRNRRVGTAMLDILNTAGVRYGCLGAAESCCGDQARRIGAQDVYDDVKQQNMTLFEEHGVRELIVASPHCLQTINQDYAKGTELHATHYATFFHRLVQDGHLILSKPIEAKVTYHDPCYLGRHAGEYEAPRELLRAIPGLQLLEMPRNRERSLCCGGGGGGIWLDVPSEERFSVLRVQEALRTGAEIIATACPYCTAMLEDAIKNLDVEHALRVLDIAELVAQSMTTEAGQ
ncbi:MAG TPA: (Fe-S)-binding protein [Polyangiaceae bacterium]|nr:MAG: Anaerobic glycerol-3-phosphate dehydrogenase subunit C [Deltaproteobacteria bacterium ADurb.Bin207]HNS99822.1 (Fe-S)-binding protein [Polyangiaceae bacterium]HNZ25530.1 (Fe-S)-binding protein [Polyangiaceae bacterium]HOD25605.1 (Fe-S)-binding protein [Polyangiaceae bacterium]HOE51854.1 (Fe-S)-binding protein [Polyangiaceae bacterium]